MTDPIMQRQGISPIEPLGVIIEPGAQREE